LSVDIIYNYDMNSSKYWSAAFIVVGVLLGMGILLLVTRPPRGEPITLLPAPTSAPIIVSVNGSVQQAGLYALPYGSRVNDAIQAAGGFSQEANVGAINLAEILKDGEQVSVPSVLPTTEGGASRVGSAVSGLININTASLEALDTLPAIGPVTAQRIIGYRAANGPFVTIEGLLEVDGIGQATFDKIKGFVTVGTSP
jgi:competence protein ComEA